MMKGISVPKEPKSLARNTLKQMIWKALSPIWVIYNNRGSIQIIGLQLSTFHSVFYTDGQMVPLEPWVQPPGTSLSCRYSSGKWLPPVGSGPLRLLPPWRLAHLWRPHMVVSFRTEIQKYKIQKYEKQKGMWVHKVVLTPCCYTSGTYLPPGKKSDHNLNCTFLTVFTKIHKISSTCHSINFDKRVCSRCSLPLLIPLSSWLQLSDVNFATASRMSCLSLQYDSRCFLGRLDKDWWTCWV